MTESLLEKYRRLLADGKIAPDSAQALAVEKLQILTNRLMQLHAARAHGLLLLFHAPARRGAEGPLHLRRRRARQNHADGPVLQHRRGQAEAARAFPRVHGGRACQACRRAAGGQGRPNRRRGQDRRRGGAAALPRRAFRHRHRGRDDPEPAVRHAVPGRHDRRRHLEQPIRATFTRTAATAIFSCPSSISSKRTWSFCSSKPPAITGSSQLGSSPLYFSPLGPSATRRWTISGAG